MNYIGSGTAFPFKLLKMHSEQSDKVFRILISDSDFLHNVASNPETNTKIIAHAVKHSKRFVAVLARVHVDSLCFAIGDEIFNEDKFSFVEVQDFKDFANVSADLARSLLGDNP